MTVKEVIETVCSNRNDWIEEFKEYSDIEFYGVMKRADSDNKEPIENINNCFAENLGVNDVMDEEILQYKLMDEKEYREFCKDSKVDENKLNFNVRFKNGNKEKKILVIILNRIAFVD